MFPLEKIGVSANIKVIGVTGNVASGKSTLLKALEKMGVSTLSVDTIIHNLYQTNEELINKIHGLLGDDILTNTKLDKKKIATKVFNSKEHLCKLEELTTPYVVDEIKKAAKIEKSRLVVEVPLLFELSLEDLFDITIFVKADPKLCSLRSTLPDFKKRLSRFLPQEEKEKKADYTITNNGTFADFQKSIESLMKGIIT
jgi:dephospho-CoA kinase